MRVLDLYCCAGGAGKGYIDAGCEVIGVDIVDRPNYPGEFIREDAIRLLVDLSRYKWLRQFDFIHASPPCQRDAAITRGTNQRLRGSYPRLYEPTKELLLKLGIPFVIENPAARNDVVLCGEMFGLSVIRHRRMELGRWTTPKPQHKEHRGRVRGWRHGIYYDGPYVAAYGQGGGKATIQEMQQAMGITWTHSHEELREAIPPAYTRWIAERFQERKSW